MPVRAVAAAGLFFALAAAGCFSPGEDDPGADGGGADPVRHVEFAQSVSIDPTLASPHETTVPTGGDPDRPVVVGKLWNGGEAASHKPKEIVVVGSRADAQATADRTGGEIVQTIDLGRLRGFPHEAVHVIQADPPSTDAANTTDDFGRLKGNFHFQIEVSGQDSLDLLHAIVKERLLGVKADFNWLMSGDGLIQAPPQTFLDGSSLEAPTGPGGYDPNAFAWTHLGDEWPIAVGVPTAWQTLERFGRLDNKVKVAIIDGGFAPSTDLPDPVVLSAVDQLDDDEVMGTPNFGSCGGNACPWHGLGVAHAGLAAADNSWGVAGPAGPIVEPILIFTDYSTSSTIDALVKAWIAGADIVSMSYSGTVLFGSWDANEALDLLTRSLHDSGAMLLFASAGNSNTNLEQITCTTTGPNEQICWETGWTRPCENTGVICVGGTDGNGWKHASSSFASDSGLIGFRDPGTVDVFASYTMFGTQGGGTPTNQVRNSAGTSVSAPFAAGVAALIWAADPGLTNLEVEQLLIDTLTPSPSSFVPGIVNAAGAIAAHLCGFEPSIEVQAPFNLQEFEEGDEIMFSLTGEAVEPVTLQWEKTSIPDLGSILGTAPSFVRDDLPLGLYSIRVEALDACGQLATDSFQFWVREAEPDIAAPTTTTTSTQPGGPGDITSNSPPSVAITSHEDGEQVFGQPQFITLEATATDPEDGPLTGPSLQWQAAKGGGQPTTIGQGEALRYELTGCDDVAFTVVATDGQGAAASDSVLIDVVCPQ